MDGGTNWHTQLFKQIWTSLHLYFCIVIPQIKVWWWILGKMRPLDTALLLFKVRKDAQSICHGGGGLWLLFEGWCMAGWLLSEGLQCWYNDTLLPATARAGRLKPDLGPGAVPGPGHHDSVTHIRDAECGPPHVITSWHTQPPSSDRQIQQIEISTTKYVVNLY